MSRGIVCTDCGKITQDPVHVEGGYEECSYCRSLAVQPLWHPLAERIHKAENPAERGYLKQMVYGANLSWVTRLTERHKAKMDLWTNDFKQVVAEHVGPFKEMRQVMEKMTQVRCTCFKLVHLHKFDDGYHNQVWIGKCCDKLYWRR